MSPSTARRMHSTRRDNLATQPASPIARQALAVEVFAMAGVRAAHSGPASTMSCASTSLSAGSRGFAGRNGEWSVPEMRSRSVDIEDLDEGASLDGAYLATRGEESNSSPPSVIVC